MKSAYELAMERLEKQSPTARLSDEQRAAIAEIEASYRAKIAEREVFLQVSRAVRRLQEECEDRKAKGR